MTVTVSRAVLALDPLDINDHATYRIAAQFLGGQVAWNRTQVTSPFVDGQITTNRSRQNVTEPVAVEVYADSNTALQGAVDELVTAFLQDHYFLDIQINGSHYRYLCEAADYQLAWTGPRLVAQQGQVVFSVPRQPVPYLGVA